MWEFQSWVVMALPQSVKLLAYISIFEKKKQISVKFVEGPYLINSLEQPKLMRSLQMYRGKCQWKSMIEYKYIFWEVHSSGKCIYSVCAAILRLLKLWFELPFRFKCCWPPSIIQIKPYYFGIEESKFDLIIMMKFKLIHAYVTHLFEDKFLTNDQIYLHSICYYSHNIGNLWSLNKGDNFAWPLHLFIEIEIDILAKRKWNIDWCFKVSASHFPVLASPRELSSL